MVFACATSAGIHAGIVPEHLREEPRLGVAFIVAVLVLLATAAAVCVRPSLAWVAAPVLGGLALAYVDSRTTGIPLLAPDPEVVDPVGIVAAAIELLGVLCALWLAQSTRRPRRRPFLEEEIR